MQQAHDYIVRHYNAFETFLLGSIFDKTVFCLGEKEAMLVNDECSSWYNREGNFLVSVC